MQSWEMPAPPSLEVAAIRDAEGRTYQATSDPAMWRAPDGQDYFWGWLVYQRGPITAERLVP